MPAPVPADSSTVILLREPVPGRLEVLLVARHSRSRAFAGAHVFPGGLVDVDDASAALVGALPPHVSPAGALATLAEERSGESALAFWIAGIRELFEEAGILLAQQNGTPLSLSNPSVQERFAEHRRALVAGSLGFGEIARREGLTLLTDELVYFSRWITPIHAPRRYDARFFLARMPAGQTPMHDEHETTAAEWWTPADALAAAGAGTMTLTPPTARTLEELDELGSCEGVFADARQRRVVPILPKVVQLGTQLGVLYPGDVAYDTTEAGGSVATDGPGPFNRAIMDDAGFRRLRG
jgi:8-oxo-dGTP pyrophosphatase MutT (NUDIX family)